MTFKGKLILAQAPLALALALIGALSTAITTRLGTQSGRIFVDNYRSVRAAQIMADSLELINRNALFLLAGHGGQVPEEIARNRGLFEQNLRIEESNITEQGEAKAAASLRQSWTHYQQLLDGFLAATDAAQRDELYFGVLTAAEKQTKERTDAILDMNQDAIGRKSDRAERSAHQFRQLVTAAVLAALLGGLLLSVWLTARLLRPLGVVGAAVRRFGQGDLHARARLDGHDEVAQLAAEFNTMADRLERYRASSLGELIQAQQASQAAIDGLPDPVILQDASGRVQGINQATSHTLGVDPDLKPTDPLAHVDPAIRSLLDRLRTHVVSGRGPYAPSGFEEALHVPAADGKGDHIFLPRAAPVYGDAGEVVGVAIVLEDVTRLFRFDELKNNLVATVAHEFRTPLTSLRMAIHLCTEEAVGPLTPKQADLLFAAREDCERLQGIVDDLLNVARIESGNITLHKRRVSTELLVSAACDVHQAAAQSRQITLRPEVEPGCPEAFADPDRLSLVFSNLLGNAIRYAPVSSEIVIRARWETTSDPEPARWIRFEVTDQGPGISAEHQAELFQRFYRVPGSPAGGSGLGLFIARGIVQAHGGQIGVTSHPGQGSTFWFTIPSAPDAVY